MKGPCFSFVVVVGGFLCGGISAKEQEKCVLNQEQGPLSSLFGQEQGRVWRSDYQPLNVNVANLTLSFSLDASRTYVVSEFTVLFTGNNTIPSIALDGDSNIQLHHIWINNVPLNESQYEIDPSTYQLLINSSTIDVSSPSMTIRTNVSSSPTENLQLMGLYESEGLLSTQCEPHGFRRITYFFDRPDILTVFTVRIEAAKDKYPVLLSNGNLVDQGQVSEEVHYVVYNDPFPKPTYLFALVAGNLSSIEDSFTYPVSGKVVDLKVWSSELFKDSLTWAMESLKRAMLWDFEAFGREYDLKQFHIVCISDFNVGAMENKGLNIFNTAAVVANATHFSTDADLVRIEAIVAHEYFHNWSGDRVTCRDWFQLTLKEGFTVFRDAQFTSDTRSRSSKRIEDVMFMRNYQFQEDSSPLRHPIRPESFVSIDNFYTATVYEKGAEVVRMYKTLMGSANFRNATDQYFAKFDGKAVTCDDFRLTMQECAPPGTIDSQFENWYSVAGTPIVQLVEQEYDEQNQTFSITLHQSVSGDDDKLLVIPIITGLVGSESHKDIVPQQTLVLRERVQTFVFTNVSEFPIPSLLRDFSAPVILNAPFNDTELAIILKCSADVYASWDAGQHLFKREIFALVDMLVVHGHEFDYRLPEPLWDALVSVLDRNISEVEDIASMTLLVTLPALSELVQEMTPYAHPELLMDAVNVLRATMARELAHEILSLYVQANTQLEEMGHSNLSTRAMGLRSLRLWCLRMLSSDETERDSMDNFLMEFFRNAANFNDKYGALRIMCNIKAKYMVHALMEFGAYCEGNPLLMDKWFAVQAGATPLDVEAHLNVIEALLEHPWFVDSTNPNRLRSVLGVFSRNLPAFHTARGYRIMSQWIVKIDEFNSKLAARLAKSFSSFRMYDPIVQQYAVDELESLKCLVTPMESRKSDDKCFTSDVQLSKDTSEVVMLILNN